MQGDALLGQVNADLPFILGIAGALDQAGRLQPLHKRRHGAAFQKQPVADGTDRLPILRLQHHLTRYCG